MLGFGLGIGRGQRGFDPASLFVAGNNGAIYDPSVLLSVSQDIAGATPVTAVGQPVGRILDRSGRAAHATQATAAARPAYARAPVGGVRNRVNGSAAVTNSTFWPSPLTANGITCTRVGQGTDTDGLPYVDLRYAGTAVANGQFDGAYAVANSNAPATLSETWTVSALITLIAGAATRNGTSLTVSVVELSAASAFLAGNSSGVFFGETEEMRTATRTLNQATVAQVRTTVTLSGVLAGAVIDVTFRVKGMQLERSASRSAYQHNLSMFDITETGLASRFALLDDLVDDAMATTLPAGTYTVATGDDAGVTILTGQSISGAYTIPGPARLYGAVIISRTLSAPETASLTAWLNARRP